MTQMYPEDGLSFSFNEHTSLIYRATGTQIVIYQDEAATLLAPITYAETLEVVPGSILVVGPDSMLPDFLAPSGMAPLWARKRHDDGPTYPVFPKVRDQIDALADDLQAQVDAAIAGIEPGPPGPQGPPGAVAALTYIQSQASDVWEFDNPFPYKPEVDTYDQNGDPMEGDLSFPEGRIRVTFGFAMTGTMRLI